MINRKTHPIRRRHAGSGFFREKNKEEEQYESNKSNVHRNKSK
jgi:hypothetical protein